MRRVAALIQPGVIYDVLEPHDVPVRFMFRTYLHEKHTKQRNCMAMAVRRMLVYGHNCRTRVLCVVQRNQSGLGQMSSDNVYLVTAGGVDSGIYCNYRRRHIAAEF